MDFPHLMINLDINKTLIACDPVQGKSPDHVVNDILAEKTKFPFLKESDRELSYDEYVKHHLYPGSVDDDELKKKRREKIGNFVTDLLQDRLAFSPKVSAEAIGALKGRVEQEHAALNQALTSTYVFASAHRLLRQLKIQALHHTVILRSFGKDIGDVVNNLEKEHSWVHFTAIGRFEKGKLYLSDRDQKTERVFENLQEAYEAMKKERFVAIRDDYPYWFQHQKRPEYAKPFLFDSSDSSTISLFFDDNLETDPEADTNIIGPYDVSTGQPVPVKEALDKKLAWQTDTAAAIQDEAYFVHLVKESLAAHDPSLTMVYTDRK